MRQYKYSEKRYDDCINGLASQIMAIAQEDAREEVRVTNGEGDSFVDTVDDFVEAYQADAIDHLENALTKKLRRP
jgi:hypothetical protein